MADLEGLTDAQLRTKLVEYGLPVMPITGTTRKIMMKKLKLLMDTQKKSHATERRTMAKYSSDDDSDLERNTKKNRRATVAGATANTQSPLKNQKNAKHGHVDAREQRGALNLSAKSTTNTQKKKNFDNGISPLPLAKKEYNNKSSRIIVEVRHLSGNDTSSDTEPELMMDEENQRVDDEEEVDVDVETQDEENSLGISLNSLPPLSDPSNSSYSTSTSMSMGSPPKQFTSSFRSPSIQRPEPIIPSSTASRYSAFSATMNTSLNRDNLDVDLRSRHTYGYLGNSRPRTSSLSRENINDVDLLTTTPYLSNFSKRLSLLTSKHEKKDMRTSAVNENKGNRYEANGHIPNMESTFFDRSKQKLWKYFTSMSKPTFKANLHPQSSRHNAKLSSATKENQGNFVSVVLVTAVGVFFLVLLALYYGMHHGSNTNDIIGLSVPYCSSTMTQNCLTMQEAQGGIDLYKILKPKLIELAIDYQCGDILSYTSSESKHTPQKPSKFFMTDRDIVDFIKVNYKLQNEEEILNDIDSFVLIAYRNRFLGVSVLRVKEHGAADDYIVMDDIQLSGKQLETSNEQFVRAFAVLSPTLPWKCSLWQKISALLRVAVVIFGIAAILYLGKLAYKWFRYYQHKKKEEIVMLVEKIIELMQTQVDDEQFLVVNHVRDMIIPIDCRKKMEYSWSQALKFIAENESRIRTEVQLVKGESYEVWRWIGGQNLSMNNISANKSWQGQAFEVQVGGVNSPPCSPTPCLKIRGMIDDADHNSNKATIREAILSKCGPQCHVLHLAVDVNSKCVYLKCVDTSDAAIAYRNLHGQWFAGHLVTVKYLRLERYMQRFPDSPQSGPPFLRAG